MHAAHQPMQRVERIGGAGRSLPREFAQRAVGLRQRALAQVHLRRQRLDRAAHHADRVGRLDLADGGDGQALDRPP